MLNDEPVSLSVFAQLRTELLGRGYTILDGLAYLYKTGKGVARLELARFFDSTIVMDLVAFMFHTFPWEDYLKKESARCLRKSIFNAVVESIDNLDRQRKIACYTSKH